MPRKSFKVFKWLLSTAPIIYQAFAYTQNRVLVPAKVKTNHKKSAWKKLKSNKYFNFIIHFFLRPHGSFSCGPFAFSLVLSPSVSDYPVLHANPPEFLSISTNFYLLGIKVLGRARNLNGLQSQSHINRMVQRITKGRNERSNWCAAGR